MLLANIPTKFTIPFAKNAGVGYTRAIPQNPTGTAGQASLDQGFPPPNFSPVSAGGVPPFGQDFNGLLNQMSAWNWWAGTGAFPPYDATWQAAVGGYPKSAVVSSLVQDGLLWYSLVDNNLTNPDTGGAGWFVFSRIVTANQDFYVSPTGNDSNNGLSPATALLTLQAAINLAFSYGATPYVINIHVADGTYASASTPNRPGPSISIIGNAGSPGNVIINGGAGQCISVNGPNTMSVVGVDVSNTGAGVACFIASAGATLQTANTRSRAGGGAIFQAVGASMLVGTHTFAGNSGQCFLSSNSGAMALNANANYTFSTAITISTAVAQASSGGSIGVSSLTPTFTNPGNVTGKRYFADLNGIINTLGAGPNFFPGTVAGTTQTGGQYA